MKINRYWEKPVKKTRRFNKTYRGKFTKRELARRVKLTRTVLIMIVFIGISQWLTIPRTIVISNDGEVIVEELNNPSGLCSDEAMASPIVALQSDRGNLDNLLPLEDGVDYSGIPFIKKDTPVKELSEKEYILFKVKEAGLNPKIAERIIFCESSWKKEAIGMNRNGSKDVGYWQINDIHNLSVVNRIDYKKATDWAITRRLAKGSWVDWNSSKHCWNK